MKYFQSLLRRAFCHIDINYIDKIPLGYHYIESRFDHYTSTKIKFPIIHPKKFLLQQIVVYGGYRGYNRLASFFKSSECYSYNFILSNKLFICTSKLLFCHADVKRKCMWVVEGIQGCPEIQLSGHTLTTFTT